MGHWSRFLALPVLVSGLKRTLGPRFTLAFGLSGLITPGREHTRHFFLAHDWAKVFSVLREPQHFPNSIKRSNSTNRKKQVQSAAVDHFI